MFKTLRGKLLFFTGIALFFMQLILVGVLLWFSGVQQDLLDMIENQSHEDLIQTIKLSYEEQLNLARIGVENVARNPEVLTAFANRDRDRLIQLCLPVYEGVKEIGVTQFGFVDEELRSYLRLHNLEQAGDDISYRASLIKARETGQVVVGLEEGKTGFGFRAVVPLTDEGQFIGAVEYGFDFGERFAQNLRQNTGAEIFLYKMEAGESTLISGTSKEDKYQVQSSNIQQAITTGQPQHEDIEQGVAVIYPFTDVNGQTLGFIKAVHPGGTLAMSNQALYQALLLSVIAWLLGVVIIYFVVSRGLRPLNMVVDTIEQMKLHGFSHKFDGAAGDNEIGMMINSMQELAELLNKSMIAMQGRSLETTKSLGKLNSEVSTAKNAVSAVIHTTNGFSEQFNHIIESTRQASAALNEIAKGAEEIAGSATTTAENSNQTNQKALDTSNKANRVSHDIDQMIQASRAAVESVATMQSLSNEIGTILEVILTVAEETNLLALNAAIEAARAGEQGRGFAVVAEEIRKLAENTKESTHSIGMLIDRISNSTAEVVDAIHNIDRATGSSAQLVGEILADIHDITQKVGGINTQIENIAAATQQQTAASEEISASMSEIENFGIVALEALQGTETRIEQLREFIQHTEDALIHVRSVSQRWSYYELRENLTQRRAEHEAWVARVRRFEPVEFDPTRCNFGQFYYNYRPHNHELAAIYDKFEQPHRNLHEAGHRVIELAEAGRREEAEDALKALEREYQNVRAVFEEFYSVLERLFLEGTFIF
ncbi:MAG: methyl-accepting chemotaxis protein [Bacillota bacterium]